MGWLLRSLWYTGLYSEARTIDKLFLAMSRIRVFDALV
jgi:hypothetical protein